MFFFICVLYEGELHLVDHHYFRYSPIWVSILGSAIIYSFFVLLSFLALSQSLRTL
jgi:hypothetical protein